MFQKINLKFDWPFVSGDDYNDNWCSLMPKRAILLHILTACAMSYLKFDHKLNL